MLTDEEMADRMINGWPGGLPFTVCGNGSLPKRTRNVGPALTRWIAEYGIKSVNDAGSGDVRLVPDVAVYRAFDLFPRRPEVEPLDITREVMPECDLIVCRMVLNHLDRPRIGMALDLFKKSGLYLAATQFAGNLASKSPQFIRVDLREWLGNPLDMVQDGGETSCSLALWRL